jgi:hypothetical protein
MMNPISPHVSIRKTCKKDVYRLGMKLDELATIWNTGNNLKPYDKKIVDLTRLIHEV